MQTEQAQVLNGVDRGRLFDTVEAIKAAPDLAAFRFRATNRWVAGGHNRTTIQGFYGAGQEDTSRAAPFVLDADEPSVLLGEDHGANPVEFVLTALAGCLTTSMVYHAAARGITLHAVESRLEGDLDLHGFLGLSDQVRNGYEQIRVVFRVEGDAPPETLAELVELAQQRSPVFDIVSHPVSVSVELERP